MRYKLFILIFTAFLILPQWVFGASYEIDPQHTTVSFKIRHLLSKVQGTFNEFEGQFEYEPGKPELWKTDATIQAASIDTRLEQRDKHLRSADFFDVEKYPELTFKSTGIKNATETRAQLEGLLTIHGVEKPVVLDLEIHGVGKDPWGNIRSGFTASTKVNRKDFGIEWNKALDAGGFLLGDEVEIIIEVEGILAKH
ncbi:MAG TPA: YceI family protein [bacterium]|nr:YceI family protein [bacterium]